jgi:hypothetical protein
MLHLYVLLPPDKHRWIRGDQYPRAFVRTLLRPFRGTPPIGLGKFVTNLCLSLDHIGQPYRLHRRPVLPPEGECIGILNGSPELVRPLAAARRCVIGVGGLNFPDEWPTLFEDTRAAFLLQSCEWAGDIYRSVYGDRIRIYGVGIDTDRYAPRPATPKEFDFLVYNKLRWPAELPAPDLRERCVAELDRRGLSHVEIRYGRYPGGKEHAFHDLVARCRAMLFLCENETQGIAYNEALSMGVPILAWNPGRWLDPTRHAHNFSHAPASSVPYWDERCGEQFTGLADFPAVLDRFLEHQRAGRYAPRDYILDHLTLDRCGRHYVELMKAAAG